MAPSSRTTGALRAGTLPEAAAVVQRIQGEERLSSPYRFEIDFTTADGEEVGLPDLVGKDALLTLTRADGGERHVHGIALSAALTGVAAGRPLYRLVLGPRLATLAHVRRSRVFQSIAVPALARQVLGEAGVQLRLAVSGGHPAREYCVQYRESDLAFLQRILRDEGMFYWFEHDAGGHVLVIADDAGACRPIAGDDAVPLRSSDRHGDEADGEHLFQLGREQRLRPGKVTLRDFDFETPSVELSGTATAGSGGPELEWYRYPGRFQDAGAGAERSRRRLEELRFDAEAFAGEGTCLRFLPGATFQPAGAGDPALERALLLAAVRHDARFQRTAGAPEAIEHAYRNAFEAVDARLPCRPALAAPRPVALAETATVVGPSGEEVHTDRHGRVKVRFHWDREGPGDDGAGCWIRVAQAWAGGGMGAQVLPRVGQEVLVRFLDGDPDRPLVVGAVHNGRHPPPLSLPGERTRSTFRSETSPGGGGANELRLEDQAGAEELHLHAQRDANVEVVADRTTRVGAVEARKVEKDRTVEVHARQRTTVARDDVAKVDGSQRTQVTGQRASAVAGRQAETIGRDQAVTVGGARHRQVAGEAMEVVLLASTVTIGAGLSVAVGAVENFAIGGVLSRQVGGASAEFVGAGRDETVAGNATASAGGDHAITIGGAALAEATRDLEETIGGATGIEATGLAGIGAQDVRLEADKLSIVVGGEVAICLDRSGVTIAGSQITVDGKSVALKGKPITKTTPGSGPRASPKVKKLEARPEEHAFADVELVDAAGNPVANEWYRVEFPDGVVKEGRLGGDGKARVPGSKGGQVKVSFPRLHGDGWKPKG